MYGFIPLVLADPSAVLSDFAGSGGSEARSTSTPNMGMATPVVTVHGVEVVLKSVVSTPIKRLKIGVATKALEAQERKYVFIAEVTAGPLGPIRVLKYKGVLVKAPAKFGT
jgi:hypothetical protein